MYTLKMRPFARKRTDYAIINMNRSACWREVHTFRDRFGDAGPEIGALDHWPIGPAVLHGVGFECLGGSMIQ